VGDLRYPRSTYFRKVGGSFRPQTLVVASRSGKPVRALSGQDPDGRVAVSVLEAEGAQAKVELSVVEGKGDEAARGEVKLRTSDALEPVVTIPYRLHVASGRRAAPPARRLRPQAR